MDRTGEQEEVGGRGGGADRVHKAHAPKVVKVHGQWALGRALLVDDQHHMVAAARAPLCGPYSVHCKGERESASEPKMSI